MLCAVGLVGVRQPGAVLVGTCAAAGGGIGPGRWERQPGWGHPGQRSGAAGAQASCSGEGCAGGGAQAVLEGGEGGSIKKPAVILKHAVQGDLLHEGGSGVFLSPVDALCSLLHMHVLLGLFWLSR